VRNSLVLLVVLGLLAFVVLFYALGRAQYHHMAIAQAYHYFDQADVLLWECEKQTCVAVSLKGEEASDAIIEVYYRSWVKFADVTAAPTALMRRKIITAPLLPGALSAGDAVDVPYDSVVRVKVRLLRQTGEVDLQH
jgi:hypothetical protein